MSRFPPPGFYEDCEEQPRKKWRLQFTLAQLLVLLLIGPVVLALVLSFTGAVPAPFNRQSVSAEIALMEGTFEEFEAHYGQLPPADLASPEFQVFLRRSFPRIRPAGLASFPKRLSPAEALVFWLGGYWDGEKVTGFSADPRNPFTPPTKAKPGQRTIPLMEFTEGQLYDRDGDGFPEYYPVGVDPRKGAPYVFFAADANGNYSGSYRHPGVAGVAVPYRSDDGGFVNPQSFQLICAGLDNDFGISTKPFFPSGKGFSPGDYDNQTNFARRTLDDSLTANPRR